MNTNLNKQEITLNQKRKAIASLILGIINIIPAITFLIILLLRCCIAKDFYWHYLYPPEGIFIGLGLLVFLPITLLSSVVGLFLGKLGLKSTKKNLSLIGIVLCSLSLIFSIYIILEFFR